jgi:pimeloyl-ACP methyl ester carboxylesterase
VLYGHGTGGSYRSHVESGLAADFAGGDVDGGAKLPMAMLGYDGVLHGPRKGGSTKPTSELVFNYLNPRAARDNPLQAAADLFALARALKSWSAGGVKLDPGKIALYGHSQGGNAGALAAGYEPAFGVVVLSGTGGGLIPSMLAKKNPVSVAGALPVVLSDGPVDDRHPVLSLLQMYFDRSDPLNFARRIVIDPPMGGRPRNFLHVVGSDDTYAPDATQEYFAMAAGLSVVAPVVANSMLSVVMNVPVTNNQKVGMFPEVTAVQTQYKPAGYDGHFVSTMHASARRSLRQMIGTFLRDGKATVAP